MISKCLIDNQTTINEPIIGVLQSQMLSTPFEQEVEAIQSAFAGQAGVEVLPLVAPNQSKVCCTVCKTNFVRNTNN